MLRIAIIDDEQKARDTIRNILHLSQAGIEIAGEAANVEEGYQLIVHEKPNLVLLDIDMPDGTGFDLLKRFSSVNFKVIFITAYEAFAVKAFKFSALDYILKPFQTEELLSTIHKAVETIENEISELKFKTFLSNLDKLKKIVLRTAESIHIVNLNDIIRLEADVNYTRFFLVDNKKLLVSKSLKEYDEMLCETGFFRAHQSHLVNLDHIQRFDKTEGGHLVMDDDSQVPVSSRKRETLFKIFERLG
ncbi:MAG: response regulator transcription factor [Clostridia bacterium]|nr:response regulator transcription factor [Clostridia bacterium]